MLVTTTASDALAHPVASPSPSTFARLTTAECRVLMLLAQGLAPKQAAWELQLALSTVRTHIASCKRKTGARTLQQLVGAFAEAAMTAQIVGARRHADPASATESAA